MRTITVLLLVAAAGCVTIRHSDSEGTPTRESVSIDRGRAEMVRAEIKMAAGELTINGGATKLVEGELRYNLPLTKPTVRYDATSFRGHLTIEQSGNREITLGDDIKNIWDLRLNNETPLDLILNMGAGESTLNLGQMDLRRVDVHMGVGQMKMDLRGEPKRDYDVQVRGGVGEATIYVPTAAGVVAEAKGGIGGVQVRGLRKDGDRWINDNYGSGKPTVRIDVKGGIGAINIYAE